MTHCIVDWQTKNRDQMTPMQIRERARECALEAVEQQKKQFRSWSILGDWDNSYLTLTPGYEARQMRVFKEMVRKSRLFENATFDAYII